MIVERLQGGWHSPMYAFFQAEVSVGYDEGHKYHFFKCASRKCKGRVKRVFATIWTQRIMLPCLISRVMQLGALVRILLSQHSKRHSPEGVMDQYSLHSLAKVNNLSKYLTMLILLKNRWVLHLYFNCSHLWTFRAYIARWCAENNHSHRIVKDHQFDILMKAGHPGTSLPSPSTVLCDIKAAFEQCCECIDTILKVSLQICIMDCLFNLCIGTLQACTFYNWCMDIPKSLGLHHLDSAPTPLQKDFGILTWYHWGAKGNISAWIWYSTELIVYSI